VTVHDGTAWRRRFSAAAGIAGHVVLLASLASVARAFLQRALVGAGRAVLLASLASAGIARADDHGPPERVLLAFGKGLRATSATGRWSLELRGRLQLQAAMTSPDDGDPSLEFLARRARLTFRGRLGDEHVEYHVQFGLAPRD
jgi:hypothetical protein